MESDDDAPESVPLSQSKNDAIQINDAVKTHRTNLRNKRKEVNKARNARFKALKDDHMAARPPTRPQRSASPTTAAAVEMEDIESERSTSGPDPEFEKAPPHLPDTIFAAAASSASREKETSASMPVQKRRKLLVAPVPRRPKDVIVGDRTVRPMAVVEQVGAHIALQRPQEAKKFRDRSLNTDGLVERKRWQRIETHLAMSGRTAGPARRFVQSP